MAQRKITSYSSKKPTAKKSSASGKGKAHAYPGAVDTGMRVYRRRNGTLFTR